MKRLLALLAAGGLAIGAAQAITVSMVNTFDLGQAPPAGVPGPAAPLAATSFSGVSTIHALGVVFSFISPTGAAIYGDSIGTTSNLISPPFTDPLLDGPSDGTLTLTFDQPSSFISFDVLLALLPGDSGGQITLNGVPHSFSTTGGQGFMGFFSIGHVSLSPAFPLSQAVITFGPNDPSVQFAIDNLSYDVDPPSPPPVGTSVPEPAALTLFGAGFALIGAVRRRNRAVR